MAIPTDLDAERRKRKRPPRVKATLARNAKIAEAVETARRRGYGASVSLAALEGLRDEIAAEVRRGGDERAARAKAGEPAPANPADWYGPAYPAYLRLRALNWAIQLVEAQIGAGNMEGPDRVISPVGL